MLNLQEHRTTLTADACALQKLARYMRDIAASRPNGSVIASDLERWSVAILCAAEAIRAGAERLPLG